MNFQHFKTLVQQHFAEMTSHNPPLFQVDVDKDELWNLYLDSFPAGTNPIYRKRREFDCSCCRHFIKSVGNVVSIDDNNKLVSVWDIETNSPKMYQPVADALSAYCKAHAISDLWLSPQQRIGTDKNHERSEDGTSIITWDHFCLDVSLQYVKDQSEINTKLGNFRGLRGVFKRALDTLTFDSIDTVLELISQNSLYRGKENQEVLTAFRSLKTEYDSLADADKENWTWNKAWYVSETVGRIRNSSIGTLLVNLSEGMDLDVAVRAYETIVAPANYKRPKAIYTKRMLEDAKKTVTELGYMDSLPRRFATLDDIAVNNVLFSNKDATSRIKQTANPFDTMAGKVSLNPRRFSRVEEVSADKFFSDILPGVKSMELFVENRHASNMVSLIAPVNRDAVSMFKWNNGFSWAYSGNVTDSPIRENVKKAGGEVDGALRFSIQWNDGKDYDGNDLDAHCFISSSKTQYIRHIYYGNPVDVRTKGELDVDIRYPKREQPAVENITWGAVTNMQDGEYKFVVKCYSYRGGRSGFRAEIAFNGDTYSFDNPKPLCENEGITVATVVLKDGKFSLKQAMQSSLSNKEIWGVQTNQFVPVTVVMYSPNYWDEQKGIGNLHHFFMLKGCTNPETPNGFYNEFVKQELLGHKRVFEALGSQMAVQQAEDQLSGVGFSSTKRNDVVVKIKGATERILKIKF